MKKKPPSPLSQKQQKLAARTHFPTPSLPSKQPLSDEKKMEIIEARFRDIMETLGLDLTDPSLSRTPHRVAKMFVQEIFSGLKEETFPSISFVDDSHEKHPKSQIVFTKVSFTSFCEHHFVPMQGIAYVAYKPHKKLIGLSKIPRIVRYFARRPQLQERLTAQIADSLAILLDSGDVAVSINATHFCVVARGVEDPESSTITNVLRGSFQNDESLRREFFEAIHRSTST